MYTTNIFRDEIIGLQQKKNTKKRKITHNIYIFIGNYTTQKYFLQCSHFYFNTFKGSYLRWMLNLIYRQKGMDTYYYKPVKTHALK